MYFSHVVRLAADPNASLFCKVTIPFKLLIMYSLTKMPSICDGAVKISSSQSSWRAGRMIYRALTFASRQTTTFL